MILLPPFQRECPAHQISEPSCPSQSVRPEILTVTLCLFLVLSVLMNLSTWKCWMWGLMLQPYRVVILLTTAHSCWLFLSSVTIKWSMEFNERKKHPLSPSKNKSWPEKGTAKHRNESWPSKRIFRIIYSKMLFVHSVSRLHGIYDERVIAGRLSRELSKIAMKA